MPKNRFLNFSKNLNDIFSSKELCAFFGMICLLTSFVASTFFHFVIERFIFDGFLYLVIGCLGLTIPERFAPQNNNNNGQS